jgi:hypothetical protein
LSPFLISLQWPGDKVVTVRCHRLDDRDDLGLVPLPVVILPALPFPRLDLTHPSAERLAPLDAGGHGAWIVGGSHLFESPTTGRTELSIVLGAMLYETRVTELPSTRTQVRSALLAAGWRGRNCRPHASGPRADVLHSPRTSQRSSYPDRWIRSAADLVRHGLDDRQDRSSQVWQGLRELMGQWRQDSRRRSVLTRGETRT